MPIKGLAYCCAVKRKICRRHLLPLECFPFILAVALLLGSTGAVVAQTSAPVPPAKTTRVTQPSGPNWSELSSAQREALAPLSGMWETLEPDRKKKWLEMAGRFPGLTPDAQKRMHERMGEYARLTPEQRMTARENFRQAYELPAEQRQQKLAALSGATGREEKSTDRAGNQEAGNTTSVAGGTPRSARTSYQVTTLSIDSVGDRPVRAPAFRFACRRVADPACGNDL